MVWKNATENNLEAIPADIKVSHYSNLKLIGKDFAKLSPDCNDVRGIWIYGLPGVGKSKLAR